MKYYKIYGERNCGTNLVRELLKDNNLIDDDVRPFKYDFANFLFYSLGRLFPKQYDEIYERITYSRQEEIKGWKHGYPKSEWLLDEEVIPIFVVKHPIFWMESIKKKPFHIDDISGLYKPRRIENFNYSVTLFEMYIMKLERYYDLAKKYNGIIIQYESLTAHKLDSKECLESMGLKVCEFPTKEVRTFVNSNGDDYLEKYSNQNLDVLSKEFKELIPNKFINMFGYGASEWQRKTPIIL